MVPKENIFLRDAIFRVIKISDIAFITVCYFIVGYNMGFYIDTFFTNLYGTEYNTKSKNVLLIEVVSQIMFIGIASYIGRNIVQLIPFPLDGVYGFEHLRVKEVASGGFLTVFLVMFQYSMQDKILYIKKIVSKKPTAYNTN
jgi:hypothetical protein